MLLRLPLQILLGLSCLVEAGPLLRKRDADFESVRTRLTKDHSGKGGDPKQKYFHESTVRNISQPRLTFEITHSCTTVPSPL
jgi:hypothetical protein